MRISSAQIIRNFGKYSDLALSEPIIVTKNGRDRLVLIGVDEYNYLREWMESGKERQKDEAAADSAKAKDDKKLA